MNVLIVYATNSSGTQQAAHLVRDVLISAGHRVDCRRVYHVEPQELGNFDLVILGSCTWDNIVDGKKMEGQLQEHMEQFAGRLPAGGFPGRRFAVFALGDSSYTNFCTAADHLEHLVEHIGGTRVGESLRVDGFFFDPVRNHDHVRRWAQALSEQA